MYYVRAGAMPIIENEQQLAMPIIENNNDGVRLAVSFLPGCTKEVVRIQRPFFLQ
jgi:hypothetical protein